MVAPAPPPIIELRTLDTAEELFHEISPVTGEMWKVAGEPDWEPDWIFRGQANSPNGNMWTLRPAAFRAGAFTPYAIANIAVQDSPDGRTQRAREMDVVLKFAASADRHGFVIPGDQPDLRDARAAPDDDSRLDPIRFPPPSMTAMFALAQHHGIPTRLLDWTWKALVAVYFAAESVARRRAPGTPVVGDPPFSVFALRRAIADASFPLEPTIHMITVPTATNANLHAQGGLFTLVQHPYQDEHPLPDLEVVLERLRDRIATRHDGQWQRLFPFLVEYRVPAREARTALMLLAKMGLSAASVYPNLGGVAQSIQESRFFQWAPPGQRS